MPDVFLQQREEFSAYTMSRIGVSRELFDEFNRLLAPHVTQLQFRKGDYLQRAGVPASVAYWLYRGVARRGMLTRDGSDVTMAFSAEGDSCGSHHDLLAAADGQPAQEFIIAETPVTAVRVEWATLARLREEHSMMREYYLKVSEHSIRRYSQSCLIRSMTSANCRLAAFREQYPGLEHRISQKSLASFLGITPQYMSTLLRQEVRGQV
ncbi:Crp/Fnr family transcriptional regulator [Pseudoduganella guangdongensis]|uniref:Crp/Fnr family transcriptional regulator n=1 Tax=Pseudoduganella guangdongensis TaxID=2692179 RepID=UPI001E54B32D|nr:Crp/Fnr family transcriptional regulator [Pseudoduganella guangdongensis]